MPHRSRRGWLTLAPLVLVAMVLAGSALAGEELAPAPPARTESPRPPLRRAMASPSIVGAGSGWGWTLGGVALMLAALGWASLAARRSGLIAGREAGPIRVVGRTALGPKHAVYLLRAGDRLLIVGTGPAGAPALLGTLPGLEAEGPTAGGAA